MHKTEFNYMWEDSVFPLIKKCDEQLDADYKFAVSLRIRDLNEYKAELSELYHHKRNWLKKEYLPYDEKATLDFHKLSAVMCRCIIGNKPFVFDQVVAEQYLKQSHNKRKPKETGTQILRYQIDNIYVNYKLAFLVAESIVFDDLVQWAQRQIGYLQDKTFHVSDDQSAIYIYQSFIDKMNTIGILADYEWSNRRHDPFYESMVSCLIKNDILKRDFDYLLFAANMFQWQEYTKRTLFGEIVNEIKCESVALVELINGKDESDIQTC